MNVAENTEKHALLQADERTADNCRRIDKRHYRSGIAAVADGQPRYHRRGQ